MANRNFLSKFYYSFMGMPVQLIAKATIGSSGAPTLAASSSTSYATALGVASITRLVAGTYRLQLQDNYRSIVGLKVRIAAPVTGSAEAGGAFTVGTVRQIVTLGTTTQAQFVTAGVPAGITAAPGVVFKVATVGAGTGTVKAIGVSGITCSEMLTTLPNTMLAIVPTTPQLGGYVDFQTLGATSSSVTTLIPTDPASGSALFIEIDLNNSSVN